MKAHLWIVILALCLLLGTQANANSVVLPPGDVNGDGGPDVVDVQCVITHVLALMSQQTPPACAFTMEDHFYDITWSSDLNCSENTDIIDITLAITLALGAPLPAEVDVDQDDIPDSCQFCEGAEPCISIFKEANGGTEDPYNKFLVMQCWHLKPNCNDENQCTQDVCDAESGMCINPDMKNGATCFQPDNLCAQGKCSNGWCYQLNGDVTNYSCVEGTICEMVGNQGDEVECPVMVVREDHFTTIVSGLQFSLKVNTPWQNPVVEFVGFFDEICFPAPPACFPVQIQTPPNTLSTGHSVAIYPYDFVKWKTYGQVIIVHLVHPNVIPLTEAFFDQGTVAGDPVVITPKFVLLQDIPPEAPVNVGLSNVHATDNSAHNVVEWMENGLIVVGCLDPQSNAEDCPATHPICVDGMCMK